MTFSGERFDVSTEDLARAARLLVVRSRREATGLFAGNYASAFRGGGLEFDESRPYVPGDDVRCIDWNATARHAETFVKRHREERDQTLLFALDVSSSMRFGSVGASKAGTAAHALALLAAAATRAGDRMGLVAFDDRIRALVAAGRGVAHGRELVRTAVRCAAESAGATSLAVGLRAIPAASRRRGVLVILSDFRDDEAFGAGPEATLAELTRRHDVVAAIPLDARELDLPRVGAVRLADPERPERSVVLDTSSRRARRGYLAACEARRRDLDARLRRVGAEVVWLRCDRNPLHPLGRFFNERAGRRWRGR